MNFGELIFGVKNINLEILLNYIKKKNIEISKLG
jgi:hypothetical protein